MCYVLNEWDEAQRTCVKISMRCILAPQLLPKTVAVLAVIFHWWKSVYEIWLTLRVSNELCLCFFKAFFMQTFAGIRVFIEYILFHSFIVLVYNGICKLFALLDWNCTIAILYYCCSLFFVSLMKFNSEIKRVTATVTAETCTFITEIFLIIQQTSSLHRMRRYSATTQLATFL